MNDRPSFKICFCSKVQRKRPRNKMEDDTDAGVKKPPNKRQKIESIEELLKLSNLSREDWNQFINSKSNSSSNQSSNN